MENVQNGITQRQNRTKEHLKAALIRLIKETGYHAVTVKDIVASAAYNRSTFYVHYRDKIDLAEDLMKSMLQGLEASVGIAYITGQKVWTANLNAPSFNIVSYIYRHRDFFELIKCEDTLPGLHTEFPQTILKIYKEQFVFETINKIPVNMDYFKLYTAYGFYGLILNWIQDDFREPQDEFIQKVMELAQTHIYSFKYTGR
ncbi:TetR family transcriptional regulator [Paenibacillus sp. J31TS4]|uniref:TetR/AcrR family transcriptional regulator n=1 Tax=Paenibacillus sp. J31TS4 TaxID=2807195 RepID=UPI001B1B5195|nr:TetR/AcrR family transcriptional regulator [Paenibacillus sp. J31TS4]GIP40575.1 TetR family transcriptional regulator [Paenibacillus sp. J31TS4]